MNKFLIIIPIIILIIIILVLIILLKKRSNFIINKNSELKGNSTKNQIDKLIYIFIINLDKRKDRLIECEQEISTHNLNSKYNFKRIKAIDGEEYLKYNKLDENLLKRLWNTTENSKWDKKLKPNIVKELSAGEIGCCLSHLKTWKEIKNKNLKFGVILEDDFKLNLNYNSNLLNMSINFVEKNHENIDILYLGGIDNSKFSTKNNYKFGINKSDFIFCLHSYIITKRGIDKIIKSLPIIGSVDLFVPLNLEIYRIYPFIISQRNQWNVKSDISHSAHSQKFNVN